MNAYRWGGRWIRLQGAKRGDGGRFLAYRREEDAFERSRDLCVVAGGEFGGGLDEVSVGEMLPLWSCLSVTCKVRTEKAGIAMPSCLLLWS